LVAALTNRGADVLPVTPYRYASQADSARVAEAIHGLATGSIAMVGFTSSPQVERLAEVARLTGLEKQLAEGLARARVASIGPIVTQTLRRHGVMSVIQPESSFHLKPLVREIIAAWSRP
jgi:uroporphyrinogen-III synthase